MDKILFLIPPTLEFEDFINPSANVRVTHKKDTSFGSLLTELPLGVLALSAYLKKYHAAETKLIDFNIVLNKLDGFEFHSFDDFFSRYLSSSDCIEYNPTIIGISALFMLAFQNILDIADCCRKIFPHALVVAGGGVATNMYAEIFSENNGFTALCYGEGEKPLRGLAEATNKKRYLEDSPSWITKAKVEKAQVFIHDFIINLDEIPIYDYSLCQLEDYRLNSTISAYPYTDSHKKYITVMTSRGCTHRCIYCSAHTVHGRTMRYYSVRRVREDFEQIKERYGAEVIIFQDDHFLADKARAYEIFGILKELQLAAFFPNSLAMYALDREMLEALKGLGARQLVLAIESGSDRVLREVMHKPLNRAIIKRVASDCRELGIYTDANIIIGFPGETKQDIEDTRSFLKTTQVNWFRIYIACPLAGSEMLDLCLKKNYIKGEYNKCNFKKANIETEDFSAEYIQEMAYIINLELNFVENSDVRLGSYRVALQGFENAIKAKPDHAIAYYYASQCYEKLGNHEKAEQYLIKAKHFAAGDSFWRRYIDMFAIPL